MTKLQDNFQIIDLGLHNIEKYDIFCYKTQKGKETYQKKVNWLKKQFPLGLKFKLIVIKDKSKNISKGFIEYIPGNYSWRGISASNYMVIHCIWVDQSLQGKGFGSLLLSECLNDATNMNGIAVVTSNDSWLPSEKLFTKHGFRIIDYYEPKLKLLVKKNKEDVENPSFIPINDDLLKKAEDLKVYLSGQCPYTFSRVENWKQHAKNENVKFSVFELSTYLDTKKGVHPYGTLSAFYNKKFLMYKPMATNIVKKIKKEK